MYIEIEDAAAPYTQLKSLTFAPETDLTLASLPVNEFRADIITTDDIPTGRKAILYDDLDAMWATFRVIKSERPDKQTVRILAQSELTYMDRWTLPAQMFYVMPVRDFVDWLFEGLPQSGTLYMLDIDIDEYYINQGTVVNGFCPEQTARERLQWMCLTIGAMVQQCGVERLTIVPAPDTIYPSTDDGTLIPVYDTYHKPTVTTKDDIKALTVTAAENFTSVDPGEQQGVEWQTVEESDGTKWWYNPTQWTFDNSEVQYGQTIDISGVTIINGANKWDILNRLATAYFRHGNVDIDVINNGQYWPGMKVLVYTDLDTVYTGYIQSCDFSFGLQAKSRLVVSTDLSPVPMGRVRVIYSYDDFVIAYRDYHWPEGYDYTINNGTLTAILNNHLMIFRPTHATISGTVGETVDEITEPVYLALDSDLSTGALKIISVDSVTERGNEGVIS